MSDISNDIQKKAWSIEAPDRVALANIAKKGNPKFESEIPTLIKHSENSSKITAEHVILTGTPTIINAIRMPANRMAKYASIAIINCNLQIAKESDLKPTFEKLYPFILDYSTSKEFKDKISLQEKDSLNKTKEIVDKVINGKVNTKDEKDAQKLYETIKENYNKLQSPRLKPEEYFNNILYDRIHMKAMEQIIFSDLEPKLVEHAQKKGFKSLTNHLSNDRTTYFFAGAPASGKGTSVALRRREAINEGKNWSDMVKINTDTHRDFIIDDRLTTQRLEQRAVFNHEEATLISDMSYRLYENKLNKGAAPDMLIDAVMVQQNRLDMALKNGGNAKIDVVSLPAEKCVERAYYRGLEENRFVTTQFIVSANSSVAKNFHNILSANLEKNIEYRLFDNNVGRGEMPVLIESGDLSKGIIEVQRPDLLKNFLNKTNLNLKASHPEELYPKDYNSKQVNNNIHTGIQTNQKIKVEYKNTNLNIKDLIGSNKFKEIKDFFQNIDKNIKIEDKNRKPTSVNVNKPKTKQL